MVLSTPSTHQSDYMCAKHKWGVSWYGCRRWVKQRRDRLHFSFWNLLSKPCTRSLVKIFVEISVVLHGLSMMVMNAATISVIIWFVGKACMKSGFLAVHTFFFRRQLCFSLVSFEPLTGPSNPDLPEQKYCVRHNSSGLGLWEIAPCP